MESPVAAVVSDSVNEEGPSASSSEVLHQHGLVEEQEISVQDPGRSQDEPHRYRYRPRIHLVYYRQNVSFFRFVSFNMRDEACSAFVVLVAFWIFACMTVVLGFYGSSTIQLEPNYSLLVEVNSFFVQSIQAKEIHETLPGPMLYGFTEVPPLDVLTTWSEKHDAVVESGDHKVWKYFLNPGSKIHVSYSVHSPSFVTLPLVIAQGGEGLSQWIEDPSYPNTTISWNIIHGNGTIDLEILSSNIYHVALGNLNLQVVKVQLNFTIEALTYNTTQAHYKCSLSNHHLCTLSLHLFGGNAAVLTSPGPAVGVTNHKWYVKMNYCQRWISYFTGSASVTVLILIIIKISTTCRTTSGYGAGFQDGGTVTERPPLLSAKDDDLSSWGSWNSTSEDEEEFNDAVAILNGKQQMVESNNDHRCVCILCLDTLRDCFFLPCGHCASCFTCGTRVIEEGGVCPICRRATRKVRKIFSV